MLRLPGNAHIPPSGRPVASVPVADGQRPGRISTSNRIHGVGRIGRAGKSPVVNESDALARLTPRERRCLELVAQHYDTGQIAAELGISVTTVNGYLADARQKLGARNRKEAARMLRSVPAGPAATPADEGGADTPSDDRGRIERVVATPPAAPIPTSQDDEGSGGLLSRLLFLDRMAAPHRIGAGGRTLMIVGLVVALCLALAMSVVAAVGLVSIYTSLRS